MQDMPDYSQIIRFAQTTEGRRLIAMLQTIDSSTLNTALSNAKAGNAEAAKDALADVLNTPEAQALLKKMGW